MAMGKVLWKLEMHQSALTAILQVILLAEFEGQARFSDAHGRTVRGPLVRRSSSGVSTDVKKREGGNRLDLFIMILAEPVLLALALAFGALLPCSIAMAT